MGEIVIFERKKAASDNLKLKGEARCLNCNHIWEHEAEMGANLGFQCPECKDWRGVWRGIVTANEGIARFLCKCGCEFGYLEISEEFKDGIYICASCGQPHNLYEIMDDL